MSNYLIGIKNKEFNNPLVYIFIVFMLSSFCYEVYSKNEILSIFYILSFFIFIFYFKGIFISIILFLFFISALNNSIVFYSYQPKNIECIRVTEVNDYYGRGKVNGRIVNLSNLNSKISIGDKIIVEGEFNKNLNITKGIIGDYKIIEYKKLKNDVISKIYKRRVKLFKKISQKLGIKKAALISSVAFGYKSELDQDYKSLMKNLGISHIISISGMHLALVYSILRRVFGVKLSLIIAFAYVLFTGSPTSAIRAYIMILILNLGIIFKRNYNQLASISLAGIILLLIKPYEIYDLGFILSFLATLGIILLNKKLNKKLYKLPNSIRNTVCISISAQIFTFPIILLYFNEISLNFLIGNIIVIPLINLLIIIGNVLIILEPIKEAFNFCLYICYYIIKYIDVIMYKLDKILFELMYFHYSIAYFYVGLIITYYFYKKGFKIFIYYPLIIFIYISLLIYSPIPKIRYYYDGALLISYKGENIIIQTGEKINKEKLKKITNANKIVKDLNKINIGNKIIIYKDKNNYILKTNKEKYLLVVNYEKINFDYDIINFRKGDINEINIFDGNVIEKN